jgi:hypothetical protein
MMFEPAMADCFWFKMKDDPFDFYPLYGGNNNRLFLVCVVAVS